MTNAKISCIHYDCTSGTCRVLNKSSCLMCSFYSDRLSSARRKKAAYERIRELPAEKRVEIATKYYGGAELWELALERSSV